MLSLRISRRVLFAALFLIVAGCSVERNLKLDARLSLSPAFQPIPVRVGVFYSPEFLAATKKIELKCRPNERTDIFFIFPLGQASSELFDQIAASIFASVRRLSGRVPSADEKGTVDGVLELRIVAFEWKPQCPQEKSYHILSRISYTVNLFDPDGRLITSAGISGVGSEKPKPCFSGCKDSYATERAIRDAMADFMLRFFERPEVKEWLSKRNMPEGSLP